MQSNHEIEKKFISEKRSKLLGAIIIDGLGMVSYIPAVLGETLDIGWAPVAALLSFWLFRKERGKAWSLFTFTEELVPFTDILPSVTAKWWYLYVTKKDETYRLFVERNQSISED